MMERVNKELKQRTRVIGAFPNEESLWRRNDLARRLGSVLLQKTETLPSPFEHCTDIRASLSQNSLQ